MAETNPFPTEEELHEMLMEQLRRSIHVAMPGRIQSYDPVHQVADIVVGVRDSYPDPAGDGEYRHEDYPVLPAVPILWPRMGRWFWAASVEPGDAVQLLFNSSAIGIWRRSATVDNVEGIQRALRGVTLVGDVARHHLTHAVALLGLETYGRALNHAPPVPLNSDDPGGRAILGHDADNGPRFTLYRDGRIELTVGAAVRIRVDADGTVHLAGAPAVTKLLAIAEFVDARLATIRDAFNGHTHPAGTLAAPNGAVTGATGGAADMAELASVAAEKTRGA